MSEEDWNRCDECGKFIPLADFESKLASRVLLTPDAEGCTEEWEILCKDHQKVNSKESDQKTIEPVIVMRIGKYPPKQAVTTASILLDCYKIAGIPCNAMSLFHEAQTRRAFEVEDLFYVLQAGLSAKRWEPAKVCKWTGDEADVIWHTSCDQAHCFTYDGPEENHHRFCSYCGKKIEIVTPTEKESNHE